MGEPATSIPPSSLITEWHTSDLISRCHKRVQLKHQGKGLPEIGSAMFRGLCFHAIAEGWHMARAVDVAEVIEGVRADGRELTIAAKRDAAETWAECLDLLVHYQRRYSKFFAASKLIGCEVPVRWTFDVDGHPVDFASHIDLVFRDPNGALCVWDWKTGDTDWDGEHAGRSMQTGMYFMAVQYGSIMLHDGWIEMGEPPCVSIVNVENCKPYLRKTVGRDDDGTEREFAKGDERPERAVRFEVLCNNEAGIVEQFATRVRMARGNLWPTNPTATGCRVCECRTSCPTWAGGGEEDSNGTF